MLGPRLRAAVERMAEPGLAPRLRTPEVEGMLLAMFSLGRSRVEGDVLSCWVATAGLAFAVEALVASCGLWCDNPGGVPKISFLPGNPFPKSLRHGLDLRRRLAAAGEEDWGAARVTAERLRTGAPLETRVVLSYLFPDVSAWAEQDAREVLAAGTAKKLAACLACSLTDTALILDLAEAVETYEVLAPQVEPYLADFKGLTLTLLDGLGHAAVPILLHFFNGGYYREPLTTLGLLEGAAVEARPTLVRHLVRVAGEVRRDILELLARVPDEVTATLLAAHLAQRDVGALVQTLAAQEPRALLTGLAAYLRQEGPGGELHLTLFTFLARREPELAAMLLPQLPEKIRRPLLASLSFVVPPDAAGAELPPVLTGPPPARPPKLPLFWQAAAFTRPLLRGRSAALPLAAVEALGRLLAVSRLGKPHAGLAEVRAACDPASLAAFAWDLFFAWLIAGAPPKEQWALNALGHLGDDESARRLVPLIRAWPTEGAAARAAMGLDVLRALGTDVALMHLHGFAQKAKSRPLQDKARKKIEEIAAERGLTAEELADRLVPDLGLDAAGTLRLDFGPRAFCVGFDEILKPFVRDADGRRLSDLPKPGAGDDPEAAKSAHEIWKALKKDAKTLAAQQILRLELAMCSRRRWEPALFRMFFVEHPLLQHLVRRLVWSAWDADLHLLGTFRVEEDSRFADPEDEAWELPAGASVGLVHRLDLTDELAARWGTIFGDYKILQPFHQLGRDVWTIQDAERESPTLHRLEGEVATVRLLGLVSRRGWRREGVDGFVCELTKPLPGGAEALLRIEPGYRLGIDLAEEPEQTVEPLTLSARAGSGEEGDLRFGDLDPVTFSELVRDLESLR